MPGPNSNNNVVRYILKQVQKNGTGSIDDLDFEKFRNYFKTFVSNHKKCGADCLHLKRFY